MRARWRAASEARPSHHAKVWALVLGSVDAGGAPAKSAALRESGGKVGQNMKPVGSGNLGPSGDARVGLSRVYLSPARPRVPGPAAAAAPSLAESPGRGLPGAG